MFANLPRLRYGVPEGLVGDGARQQRPLKSLDWIQGRGSVHRRQQPLPLGRMEGIDVLVLRIVSMGPDVQPAACLSVAFEEVWNGGFEIGKRTGKIGCVIGS